MASDYERPLQDAEIVAGYWLSIRILRIILHNEGAAREFRRYFRRVLRVNSGIVHKRYGVKAQRGSGSSGRMETKDQIKDLFDVLCNELLPQVIPEDYVAEIRADFADGLNAAERPERYVSLRDLDDGYGTGGKPDDYEGDFR